MESNEFRESLSPIKDEINVDDDKSIERATRKAAKQWAIFCKTVFTRGTWWKIRGLPQYLKYLNMTQREVREVQKSFFTFYTEATTPSDGEKPLNNSI